MMKGPILSGQVEESALFIRKSWKGRLYTLPFIFIYGLWGSIVTSRLTFGLWDDLWLIPLILTMGVHFLIILSCHWSVRVDAIVTCKRVEKVDRAELIMVIPKKHCGKAALAELERNELGETFFHFQRRKFVYDENKGLFCKLRYPIKESIGDYCKSTGLTNEQSKKVELYYGKNKFDVPIPSFMELFKEHAVAPFFVFQVFCVGLWCLDEYWYYSLFTLFMLVVFESTVVAQRLKNLKEFRSMSLPNTDITVKRGNEWHMGKTEDLLPGDLVLIEFNENVEDLTVPCDMILIEGTCIVNEAMISGESTPLLKESLNDTKQPEEFNKPIDFEVDRSHLLFGGTKILQISKTSTSSNNVSGKKSFCVAYVLRTGFGTLQGKLVRTMMFSSERMTANNMEAFAFILFLLIFALAAAAYVVYNVWEDASRSRFKLLLECALIITAVVPPELPMELSLAVNNSLMALSKFAIFCMEPFRIPFAGKVDVCCFDKTGTLTAENLVVKGVAGLTKDEDYIEPNAKELPKYTKLIIATCHSLFKIESREKVVGDPMEKASLDFVEWKLVTSDVVSSSSEGRARIVHRFPFSSSLKRMSSIVESNSNLVVTCKGAPEVIESMLSVVPQGYRETFLKIAHTGARVLALAYKNLPSDYTVEKCKHYSRDQAESKLHFAGFLVFHCPLKADSGKVVKALKESLHHVVMITGDSSLTAVHTAFELGMTSRPVILIDKGQSLEAFDLVNENRQIPSKLEASLTEEFDFAITGEALEELNSNDHTLLISILTKIIVFARTSPSQKELVLTLYKNLGLVTLMCGDGTNDVGALKQSHTGVALLDGKPEDLPKILKQMQTVAMRKRQIELEKSRLAFEKRYGASAHANNEQAAKFQESLQKKIDSMSSSLEQDEVPLVRLGDASVAAPFTSKISTIEAVCNIIRQGRCTLVTTMQMYKILALNSLISAYGLSVLHLEGIRYGDFQVTVTGMLLAGCFLFLSKAQPIEKLAAKRPQPNIFNWYVLLSVLLQFFLHVSVLYYIVDSAQRWSFKVKVDENTKFVPGIVNTAVYLVSLLMQVSTFVVNYQGRPFRESLSENAPLRNSLAIVGGIAFIAASEMYPEFNEWLQLVPMPPSFRWKLLSSMAIDLGGCFAIEYLCKRFLFDSRPKIL